MKLRFYLAVALSLLMLSPLFACPQEPEVDRPNQLVLHRETSSGGEVSTGYFTVYENRHSNTGRVLKLDVVVLHARSDQPQPDPVFILVGGPGQGAATVWRGFENTWMRETRDIVLVNQRGTGGANRLELPKDRAKSSLQNSIDPTIDTANIDATIKQLEESADLRMYSTPMAMDDLDDIRKALGYDKINLVGSSYGTRAALVYIRQHGESVRTAILNGVAPIEFTNPLFHAESAQYALEKIFDEVESNATYRDAFPDLRTLFDEVLARFDNGPIDVEITDPDSGEPATVQLTREAFVSFLRFQMYYLDTTRQVPVLIYRAHAGDFRPFVENAISRNRALDQSIAMGMLMCVTAAEDIARIDPVDIPRLTEGTFPGDGRVRRQMEVCEKWPKSILPDDFGAPIKSDVPTLILSGTIDPVTPPRWGEMVAKNFPNSLHIIAPAAHGVGGPCIEKIQREFLDSGSVKGLDVSCVEAMKLPPLYLPKEYVEKNR